MSVLADMAMRQEGGGVIARAANSFLAKPERERGSVLSTAQHHTAFLDDPRIVEAPALTSPSAISRRAR